MTGMRTTGDNILQAVDYLKTKRGMAGLKEFENHINYNLKDIHPEGWYPFEWYIHTLEYIQMTLDKPGYSVASRIGYKRSMNVGYLKNTDAVKAPIWVLEKVQKNWKIFYNFGTLDVVNLGDTGADFILSEYEANQQFCERMNGFLKGLLREVSGFKEATVEETSCRCRGDDCCKFELRWSV